jgi:hypothetical protein
MNDLNLSYLAGFFDGEGCISILKYSKDISKWNPSYFLQAQIGQKYGSTLDWVKENFGGNVYKKRDQTWIVTNNKAYEFIKLLEPYLKYKKPQAQLAIKFYEERIIGAKRKCATQPHSKEEMALREEMLKQMKILKRL